MNFNLCPSCLAENPDDAVKCRSCGHLMADAETVPTPFDSGPPTQMLPGGLWLDDLQQPTAFRTTQPAALPTPFTITLRNVAAPPAPEPRGLAPATRVRPHGSAVPELTESMGVSELPELVELPTLTEVSFPPITPPPLQAREAPAPLLPELPELPRIRKPDPAPAPAEPPPPRDAEVEAKRNARRASVRRSRLRALAAAQGEFDTVPEVLVVDRNDIERGILCGLLQAFGFATHSLADAVQAAGLLADHRFVAVFADIALDESDGGAGIELARRVRDIPGGPLFVLVSTPLSPIDRVRAELAGFDKIITKRVTRGSVAGVLDGHGIPMPVDARRG